MNEQGLNHAPNMSRDFDNSHAPEIPLRYDAQHWEPTEDPELTPSEKHLEMHHTPGGTLEQEVHTEIDESARQAIYEAQKDRHEIVPDALHQEFDEVSSREYEDYLAERDFEAYLKRLENDRANGYAERFNQQDQGYQQER